MPADESSTYFRKLKQIYNKVSSDYTSRRADMLLTPELDHFVHLLEGDVVLDAGCGPGRDAILLSQRGLNVTGIDIAESFITAATDRSSGTGVDFLVMNILQMTLPQESFFGIWCCAVLSHFREHEFKHALAEFSRILHKSGVLFFSVKECYGKDYADDIHCRGIRRFTHLYSKDKVRQFVNETHLSVESIYSFNERERFGPSHRDIDYALCFCLKD